MTFFQIQLKMLGFATSLLANYLQKTADWIVRTACQLGHLYRTRFFTPFAPPTLYFRNRKHYWQKMGYFNNQQC